MSAKSLSRSAFLVVLDVAVDEGGDVVGILFLFFKESFVGGAVVLNLDVIGDYGLLALAVGFFKRHEFGAGRIKLRLVVGDSRPRRRAGDAGG